MALQPSVDKEVNTLMDTYLKNPQGLEQQVRLDPSLVKGIALERVKELLKAEQNTINAQMQTPPSTVIDQEAQELTGIASGGLNEAVDRTGGAAQAKGIASAMPQSNQNMPKMASGGKVQKYDKGEKVEKAKTVGEGDNEFKTEKLRKQLAGYGIGSKAEWEALADSEKERVLSGIQASDATRKMLGGNLIDRGIDAAGDFTGYISDQLDEFGQTGVGTMLGLGGKPKTQKEIDAEEEEERFEDLPDLSGSSMQNITDMFGADQVFVDAAAAQNAKIDAAKQAKIDAAAAQNAKIDAAKQAKIDAAKQAKANMLKGPTAKPKKGLGSIYGDDLAGMQGAAMGNLKDAMTKDPVKAGDDAFKKYRERTNYSGVVAEHDRMRAEQDAVNKRYARSDKQEVRDRAINFFANVASENRGIRGLGKAAKGDLEMQQQQQNRTQAMLDKSLEMDKTYLADTMGLNKEAAEKAATAQNTTDTLAITSSQTWANMQEAERVSANAALDREFQREDSSMKRAHDRVMLILGSEEKMKQLSIAQRAELQQLVSESILEADQNDMQLMQMRAQMNAETDPEKKAQMESAIAALSQQKVQAGLAMMEALVAAGFDDLSIPSS